MKTRRNANYLEMQIGTNSWYVITPILTLTRTVDHLNPKSIDFNRLRGLLLRQFSSYSDQGFSFYRANIPTHTQTYIVTKRSQYRRRRTTSSEAIIKKK